MYIIANTYSLPNNGHALALEQKCKQMEFKVFTLTAETEIKI